jgi:hypothetical protein
LAGCGVFATPLLISLILYFWEMSGFEPAESCRIKQARYQLCHTDNKENQIFLIFKEIENGAVAK